MSFYTNRRGLALIAMWTVGGRLFNTALLDSRATESASWIAILIALVLSTPMLLTMVLMARRGGASPAAQLDAGCGAFARKALGLVLCLFAMIDAAYQTRVLVMGAQFVAFDLTPTYQLALITIATSALACLCGGLGVVGAGKLLMVPYALSVVFVLVTQFARFNPRWLMPILGYGAPVLMKQAVVFAGHFAFLMSAWLCLCEEPAAGASAGAGSAAHRGGTASPYLMLHAALAAAVFGVLVCGAVAMLIPTMPTAPDERIVALNMLLANGRTKVAYQLPMILTWFAHALTSLVVYLFVCSALLGGAFPRLKPAMCVLISSCAVFALTLSEAASRNASTWLGWVRYPLLTAVLVAMGAVYLIRERVKRNAPQNAA